MKNIFLLLFLSFSLVAQNKKKQTEMSIPTYPFALVFGSYYINFERFITDKKSITATVGVNKPSMIYLWSKIKYEGQRFDVGYRKYYKNAKYFRFYYEGKFNFEKGNIDLKESNYFKISSDSLQANGFMIAPEINFGLKVVIFKRITVTPSFGLRYYFSTINTEKLTKNSSYWQYDDWDNQNLKWEENRNTIKLLGYKKGLAPVPYLNLGFILKL